jgi:hypothetical protein
VCSVAGDLQASSPAPSLHLAILARGGRKGDGSRGDWRGDWRQGRLERRCFGHLLSMELQVRANVKKLGWMS